VALQGDGVVVPALGEAESFEPPLTAKDLEELRYYLEDYLTAPFGVYEERGAHVERTLPAWGAQLFESLFARGRKARDAYERAIDAGRCELWFSSNSPAFLGLPWELLQDPARPTPLALAFDAVERTLSVEASPLPVKSGDRDVADEHVRVDSDHRRAPRSRIALFMASIDTGLARLPSNPFSERTSETAGRITNSPSAISTNSMRSPTSRFNRRRTSSGTVICPLLVSVAAAVGSLLTRSRFPYCAPSESNARGIERQAAGGSRMPTS
jgi:hypothetical protein